MRLGIVAVLGRALSSEDFGIVAAAISVNVFFYAISDVGVGRALVQQKTIEAAHVTTAFTISIGLGAALTLLMLAIAPWIAVLYHVSNSTDIIRALGGLFFLRGAGMASRMMCQRAMRFRAMAIIDQIAFAVGSVVSMSLAVSGLGPWSLVFGYLCEEGLRSLLYVIASPPPGLGIAGARLRELLRFGTADTVSQLVSTLATYGDNYVVGHDLGARMLGYYTRAYDLIKFPSTVFDSIAGNVLFPMFSRLQDDRPALALNFRRAMFANALILLPASAALLVLAPELIRLLMGAGWDDSVLPFRVLAVTILMRTSWKVGALTAGAAGWIRGVAIVNGIYMVTVIGGAMISIHWGIVGVAATTAFAITVAFVGTSYLALEVSGLPVSELVWAHVPGFVVAIVVGGATWLLAIALRTAEVPASALFGIGTLVSILLTLGAVWMGVARGRGDFAWLKLELARVRKKVIRR